MTPAPAVDVQRLLSQLTIAEKLSLVSGASTWRTAAIDRLGIPNIKISDGPSGARGEIYGESVPAAFLPSGVSLGATWDVELLFEVGQLLAEETKSKGASVILAPTICIQRHPRGGRNFESFSEDPFLTGKLAIAHIRGVQSLGVAATPKHYVANEQETNRFHYDAIIPMRALREVYLLPFQMAVRDADPWCMMSAYNKVNGTRCDLSKFLLTDVLRDEWSWNGIIMSDWGGCNDGPVSLAAGLDLEMPGPPNRRHLDLMLNHFASSLESVERLNQSVSRVINLLEKTGRFQDGSDPPEITLNKPEHRQMLCRASASGIVMLKNDNAALPLRSTEKISKLAVVGPNSRTVVAGGGGSSYVNAPYWTSVYSSLYEHYAGTCTKLVHAVGAKVNRYVPTAPTDTVRNPDSGRAGAAVDWYDNHDLNGKPLTTTHIDDLYYIVFGTVPSEIQKETGYSFRIRATLTPKSTGRHKMSLASVGPAELYVDDDSVAKVNGKFEDKGSLFFTYGSEETLVNLDMVAQQDYSIRIDCRTHDRQLDPSLVAEMSPMEEKFQGARLGFEEATTQDLPREAANIAASCNAAIVVVGRDKEWETESLDIPMFELPGDQVRLIEEVAAVCSRTIVLVQAGTPIEMGSWIDLVQAVLFCPYGGQELGNAAVSVICGEFNPSGRLPMTFPRRIQDAPAFSSFPGENGVTQYSEGVYTGYRWWDLLGISPLFPIGHGLSYSDFTVGKSTLSSRVLRPAGEITITTQVRNNINSMMAGRQTVIAFHSQKSKRRLTRPLKQICAFAKTPTLNPGQESVVELRVTAYEFGMYDDKRGWWVVDAGSEFDIAVGTNACDAILVGTIQVPEEITWIHRIG